MRVLVTTYPEKTHFMLMAPLAWALRTGGHEVRVAVQPKFTGVVTQAGLTAVPAGRDRDLWDVVGRVPNWFGTGGETGWPAPYDAAQRSTADITWEYLHAGYRHQVDHWHKTSNVPIVADLVEFAKHWRPELVLWEPTTYAGAIAAKACGAAHGRVLIGADVFGIAREHFLRLRPAGADDPIGDWLGGYARRYGTEFTEDMVTGEFTVDQLPPSLQVHAGLRYLPMRYVPYGGPAQVPRWLWEPPARPRVALTMGLTVTDHGVGYPVSLRDILDALSTLDVEVVATVHESGRAELGPVPANVRLVPYVPLQALLPTCAVAIHHAGVGTLATTALYAVPQLALPWDVDQPTLAARMAVQGCALAIPAAKATGAEVRECVRRLLDETAFRERAARLRDEVLAMPAPNELVPRLAALAGPERCG